MSDFKVALTAGHYLGTPGKCCLKSLDKNETKEWVLNSRIADKVETLLKNYTGYKLLRTDDKTGKTNIGLTARTNAANNFKADFYLSIHHNGGVNGGSGGGIVSIVYTKVDDVTLAWQKELYNALIAATGLKGNRATPLAKMDLHECRETNMPAVLLELGFMDSKTDVPVILTESFADKCAKAIVEVIVKRAKLKKRSAQSTAVSTAVNLEVAGVQALLRQAYAQGVVRTFVKPIDNKMSDATKKAILEAKEYLGYKNADTSLSVDFIQKLEHEVNVLRIAKESKLKERASADVNGDGKVDISDATYIQEMLAGIE